jgi:hypothetical protein
MNKAGIFSGKNRYGVRNVSPSGYGGTDLQRPILTILMNVFSCAVFVVRIVDVSSA